MHVCTQQGLSHLDYCLWVTRAQVLKQDSSEKFHEETRMFHCLTTHYTSSPFVTEILTNSEPHLSVYSHSTSLIPILRVLIFSRAVQSLKWVCQLCMCVCANTYVHSCVCVHVCACACMGTCMNFLQIAQRWQEFVFRFSHRGHLRTHKKRRRQKSEWNYYRYMLTSSFLEDILNNSFMYVYTCTG